MQIGKFKLVYLAAADEGPVRGRGGERRSYLSIGDVLTLLRQEFPDVTISKIRFLESQGLVNPERTPSGYRKFYEHDVERLRWVLRQQREHFLPLKVIKGRLEQGGVDDSDAEDSDSFDPDTDDFDADAHANGTVVEETVVEETVLEETVIEEVATATTSEGAELRRRPVPVLVGQGAPVPTGGRRSASTTALPGFETPAPPPGHVGDAEMAAATFVDGAEDGDGEPAPAGTPPAAPTPRRAAASRPTGRGASKASTPAAKASGVAAAGIVRRHDHVGQRA